MIRRSHITTIATAVALLGGTACTDATSPASPRVTSSLHPVADLENLTATPTLFSQHTFNGINTPAENSIIADDFVVPAGQAWSITQVVLSGKLTGERVPFGFRANNGGIPSDVVIASFNLAPTASSPITGWVGGDYLFTLPATLTLAAGTYFITVGPDDGFGWFDSEPLTGSPGMRQAPAGDPWRTPGGANWPGTAFTLYGKTYGPYDFGGFLAPVASAPVLNSVKSGSALPIKFSLGGDKGSDILATGSPTSKSLTCPESPTVADIGEAATSTAGNSGLTYDASTATYTYVWKTDKSWANTCRTFVLRLANGSEYTANFQFKK